MKTKITIVCKAEAVKPKLKPIEFVKYIDNNYEVFIDVNSWSNKPEEWENIELLVKNVMDTTYDLMYVFDDNKRDCGYLVLGYFNDGVVE